MFVLTENWHTWYLGSADCESGLRLFKFPPQNSFLDKFGSFFLKIGMHSILMILILNPTLVSYFPTLNPFLGKLGPTNSKLFFCLKIGTHVISRLLILFPTLDFWISKPKSIFGQIWTEKLKVVQFSWKLAYRVSR